MPLPAHQAARMGPASVAFPKLEESEAVTSAPVSQQHPQHGNTQLHERVASGQRSAVRRLLREDSVEVDARNDRQETPMHIAARLGDAVLCELLIKAGGNLYASRADGQTPLHLATAADSVDCVAVLLRYGSNPRIRDQRGRYALDLIRSPEMTELYLEFFSSVRNNPGMLSLVEKSILWKDIDDIMAEAMHERNIDSGLDGTGSYTTDSADHLSDRSSPCQLRPLGS